MNSNIKKAVLKILLLQNEFTKREISEAVKFLSNNTETNIIDYLTDHKQSFGTKKSPAKTVSEQTSKAVIDLMGEDNEKYELLKSFDMLVRKGELLPSLDSIKQLGTRFNKEFEVGRSRKEGIPKLMALLAKIQIRELKNTIADITNESGKTSSEYAELANFLIHGSESKNT